MYYNINIVFVGLGWLGKFGVYSRNPFSTVFVHTSVLRQAPTTLLVLSDLAT